MSTTLTTPPVKTKYPNNNPALASQVYNEIRALLLAEFGPTCASSYWYGTAADFRIYSLSIPGLAPNRWTLQVNLTMVPEKMLEGYVYPVYRQQYTVYHNPAKNGALVTSAEPDWPLLDVAMSQLIARLQNLFEDATFRFLDPPR